MSHIKKPLLSKRSMSIFGKNTLETTFKYERLIAIKMKLFVLLGKSSTIAINRDIESLARPKGKAVIPLPRYALYHLRPEGKNSTTTCQLEYLQQSHPLYPCRLAFHHQGKMP